MDLNELKNLNMDDLKAKVLAFADRKTLIKIGISLGSIIVFLIIYYAILNPIVKEKKAQITDMNNKQEEIVKFDNDILSVKRKIKKIKPKYENYSTLFHSKAEVEGLYQNLSEFASINGLVITVIEKGKPTEVSKSDILSKGKKKKKKKKKKKCDESDPDCTVSRPTAIALLDDGAGTTLRADAYAYGKPIGTVVSSGSSSALCNDCRFLNWQRQPLIVSGEAIGLHYWVQGASATAKDLAAAAGKTATYQGGMIGSVAESGALREATGHFNSRVNFGVSHYQVTHFNADFDRNRFSGSSAATANSQPFGVTAGALSGRDGISDLTLNASGYFGGAPATPSAPPPEMGGSFSITGGDYSANGVFVGRQ